LGLTDFMINSCGDGNLAGHLLTIPFQLNIAGFLTDKLFVSLASKSDDLGTMRDKLSPRHFP
jgi:hypothetical protein